MNARTSVVLGALTIGILLSFAVQRVNAVQIPQQADSPFLQTRWTTENGLPQNTVNAIAQMPDGYLWLATFGGLARFDGIKFTIFNTSNTPQLKSNRITALYVGRNGTLWIGTETNDIVRYQNGEFSFFNSLPTSVSYSYIQTFYEDRVGTIFVGTGDNGFTRFPSQDPARAEHFDVRRGLPHNKVITICEDGEGNLWVATILGLALVQGGNLVAYQSLNGVGSFAKERIVAICPHPNGGLWLATEKQLGHFSNSRFKFFITLDGGGDYTWPTLIEGRNNDSWISYNSDQIYHLKDGKITVNKLKTITNPYAQHVAHSLFEDFEGNLWLGTTGDGLYRLRRPRVATINAAGKVSAGPIIEDHDRNIWLGTMKGLFRFSAGKLTSVMAHARLQKTPFSMITALWVTKSNTLWIGSNYTLIHYSNGQFLEYEFPQVKHISAIFEDRRGQIWIGSYMGLARFQDGRIVTYPSLDSLAHNDIRLIFEDRSGSLWLGAVGGLSRFKDGVFTHYTTHNGLSNDYVRDIYEDQDGVLWIATYGGGLNRMQNGQITQITTKSGLFDDFVSRILVDDEDQFWMLGNRGIFRVSRQELNDLSLGKRSTIFCLFYNVADGMSISEGSGGHQPAGWRMHGGRIWFSTIREPAIIDPKDIGRVPPPVFIEQVLLGTRELDLRQPLNIGPNPDNLEIHYTGLNFAKPEQVHFRYKLSGYDPDWVESGTRRTAYYSQLPPGHYTFQVGAISPDNVWSTQEASLVIVVKPPFWRTAWFVTLMILCAAGLALLVYRWRTAQYRRRALQQEAFARQLIESQERERQRIAKELHDGLGQSLVIIKRRSLLCAQILDDPEQAQEHLHEIAEASTGAIDEVKEVIFDLRPQQLDRLGLTGAVSDLLDRMAKVNKWKLSRHLDEVDGLLSKEAENSLYRVIQEIINNISKHAAATVVKVNMHKKANRVELVISDNGCGFVVGTLSILTNRGGLGLHSIVERAKLLGGQAVILSAPKQGTTIRLNLPLKENQHGN